MSDSNDSELAGTTKPLIISPEEAKQRVTASAGKGGKYNISRAEAVSIAAQIGQKVYDQLRAEHAVTMEMLQQDLAAHFADIRQTVVINILDLQRRTFSYRVRAAFAYDIHQIGQWVARRYELALAWLELHGLREAPPAKEPAAKVDSTSAIAGSIAAENGDPIAQAFETEVDDSFDAPDIASSIELHVGAPTEPPTG